MHLHKSIKLTHCIEVNADQDDQGRTSEEHCDITREVEEHLNQSRNQSDESQEDCTGENDSVKYLCEILFELLVPDSRD